jgi:dephospho-CoA kinase
VIVVGLTGGIGSGKSTVAAMLVERGAALIDADELAREVVEPGRRAYARVVERFGPSVLAPDGSLDRSAMATIVFADPASLADLNAIVHPEVRAEVASRLAAMPAAQRVVVVDIPLLVEGVGPDPYGLAGVIVVDAPVDVALERLVTKRGMDRSDAESRIANQASRQERVARADHVIMNTGTLDELEEKVERASSWIEGLAAGRAIEDGGHGG